MALLRKKKDAETAPKVTPAAEAAPAPKEAAPASNGDAPASKDAAPARKGKRHAKVIAFANQKGGVAKTTTALNLAVAFKESGHAVLAVDMDPQGNLTMSQGVDPDKVEKSMFDVLVHRDPAART